MAYFSFAADDSLALSELSPSSHGASAHSQPISSSAEQHPVLDSASESNIADEGSPVHLTGSDAPRSRQKRFLFGLGLWGLASMYSPWLWGGYWGGYGYGGYGYGGYGYGGYPYYGGYNYYYPYSYYPYGYYYPYYYYVPTQTTAAPAAVRRPLKKGKK